VTGREVFFGGGLRPGNIVAGVVSCWRPQRGMERYVDVPENQQRIGIHTIAPTGMG